MGRKFLYVTGSFVIVLGSFFGTLFLVDLYDPAYVANQKRAADVARLKDAIDRFYKDRNAYPALTGNPVDDLAKDLVPGYLKEIPADPLRAAGVFQYQYASDGRANYAIWVRQAAENTLIRVRSAGDCVTGVGAKGLAVFSHLPECQF